MSIRAMNWAMQQKTDGPSAQIVLYVVADTANEHGVSIHADPEYLAERTRQSVATVYRRLKELQHAGALTRIVRHLKDGRRGYEVRLWLDRKIDYTNTDTDTIPKSSQEDEPQDVVCDSQIENPSGDSRIAPVREPDSQSCESLKSPLKNPERETRAREESGKLTRLKGLWPTTAYDDQARIGRAWDDLTEPARDAALDRAPDWLANFKKTGRKHIPALWKFLEQEMWVHLPPKAKGANPQNPAVSGSPYDPHSPTGRALLNLARTVRYSPPRTGSGAIIYLDEITPRILAMAMAPLERDWVTYARGSQNYWAWIAFVRKVFRVGEVAGITAPWPWPPSEDGKIYSTPPPKSIEEQDGEFLANNVL